MVVSDATAAIVEYTGTPGWWVYGMHGNPSVGFDTDGNAEFEGAVRVGSLVQNLSADKIALDDTNATTAPQDIAEMALTIVDLAKYYFKFRIWYRSSLTTNGINIRLKSAGAPTTSFLSYTIMTRNSATAQTHLTGNVFGTGLDTVTVGTANTTTYISEIEGRMIVTAGGVLVPQFATGAGTASTATVKIGSYASASSL